MSIRLLLLALSSKIKEWFELDYMEYSSDANAQAAYVSNAALDIYTKSLLHFQGANNSTTFTDETGKVWTAVLNAKISTAQYKFGSSSGLFSGNNGSISDCITSPDSADWDVGNGDFTIDFWIRIHTYIAGSVILYQATTGNYAPILIRNDAIYMSSNGSSWDVCSALSYATYVADTWTHIAIVRSGNTFKTYQDGTQTNTFDSSATLMNSTASMSLMGIADGVYGTVGNMSEFRFTKGKARWTSDFTPDTAPYPQQSGYGLIDYSESTIKTQGSYSLKAVAAKTDSLNKTLTKTISPTINLTGINQARFMIRSSRTGANIKIGIHNKYGAVDGYAANNLSGGTPSVSDNDPLHTAAHTVDGNLSTFFFSTNSAFPHTWEYDYGVGVAKANRKLRLYNYTDAIKDFVLKGSNNYSDWTDVYTGVVADLEAGWQEFTFDNNTPYRYYRLVCSSNYYGDNNYIGFYEIEMMEGLGTTTEITPNIASADTWQEVKINLRNVSNADKDAIDQIIITIVNADAENIFYIDDMKYG